MKPGIDPRVDYVFKKVYGSEPSMPILAHFLNSVLKRSTRPLVGLEILNPFNDKDAADARLSILDIKARDDQGRHYNVEMQLFASHVHRHRILYYWALLHGAQLREADKYTDLRGTISVAIVNAVLFPEVADFHLEFQLRNAQHAQLIFSEQQSIHLLELPKFRKDADHLTDPLDVWCYFLTHGVDLDTENLPGALQIPPVQQAMEVLSMLSQNDVERERYQARLKWERDQHAFIDEARAQGEKTGEMRGEKTGEMRGELKGLAGTIRLCERLLKLTPTPSDELLALSLDELQAKANSLERQLGVVES